MADDNGDTNRRSFLKWASAVGLSAVAPETVAAVARENGEGPPDELPVEPPADGRDGEVTITHPTEYEGVRERVTRATRDDAPGEKYDVALERALAGSDASAYDLHVRTVGEPSTVVTERYDRQIDGWSPTEEEVQRLSQFGTVGHVPEFLSTKISVHGVDEADVSAIAELEFVLTVDLKRRDDHEHGGQSTDHEHGGQSTDHEHGGQSEHRDEDPRESAHFFSSTDPDDIRSDGRCGFAAVDDVDNVGPDSTVKIGIIDGGYDPDDPHAWPENHALPYLDTSLADQFSETWDRDDETEDHDYENFHGTAVANTLAYMLQDGWSEMIVPLDSRGKYAERDGHECVDWIAGTRAAIEFAALQDLEVINLSLGFCDPDDPDDSDTSDYPECTSLFCDELEGYVSMGYVAVSAAGNTGDETSEPGTSRFEISVGGVADTECDGSGYERSWASNYSDPALYEEQSCEPCYDTGVAEEFLPDVYGVMSVYDDDFETSINGTSFAAPQFAAAVMLLVEHGYDDYWAIKELARDQSVTEVCPDAEAAAGQLFHANDMLSVLPPTEPGNVHVEWASDTAVEIGWEPAHSPGNEELYHYSVTTHGAGWTVRAPAERIVIDGLAAGQDYRFLVSAADYGGQSSDDVEVQTSTSESLNATILPESTELSVGETARFDAQDETDDSHWLSSIEWDFDDGATDSGWYAEHTYDEPGTYWVTLRGTDNDGNATYDAVELTVS